MTNRVILGQLASNYVLKVSNPGVNVFTASDDDLMLATDVPALQIVANGSVSDPGGNNWSGYVSFPNLGYKPFILCACDRYDVSISYGSNTTARFLAVERDGFVDYGTRGLSGTIRYLVTNIPLGL